MRTHLRAAALVLFGGVVHAGTLPARMPSQIPDSLIGIDLEPPPSQDSLKSSFASAPLDAAARHGVKWVRIWASWGNIENPLGAYHFEGLDNIVSLARARDMNIMMTLDGAGQSIYVSGDAPTVANGAMTPWLTWVAAVQARYKSSVSAWEIWNEPNLNWRPTPNGAALDYADLAKRTAQQMRAYDPAVFLVLGGTSLIDLTFHQQVLPVAGGLVDAIGIHPYRQFPEQPQDAFIAVSTAILGGRGLMANSSFTATGAASFAAEVAQLNALLAGQGLSKVQIWSTETGYPAQNETSGIWLGSDMQQAKHLSRYLIHSRAVGLSRSIVFQAFDPGSFYANLFNPAGQPWVADYRTQANAAFRAFSPLYVPPGAAISIPATSFSASSNIAVTGSTIAPTTYFPNNYVDYNLTIAQPGTYQVWLHAASTDAAKTTLALCVINGSSQTTVGSALYYWLSANYLSAGLQGVTTGFDRPYYAPCVYNGVPYIPYPIMVPLGPTATLRIQMWDPGTTIDEIRLAPIGPFIERPAYAAIGAVAAIFDSNLKPAPSAPATLANGTLTAPQWSAFQTAQFLDARGTPAVAFWVGTPAVDNFAPGNVTVTMKTPLANPILVDLLSGTWTSLNGGLPASQFTLPAQDYPQILTSFSILDSAAVATSGASSVKAYPNPFLPSAGHTTITFTNLPAAARVHVYTLTGQLVKDLSADATGTAVWDVTNRDGAKVVSGVYLALAQGGGTEKTVKVVIQR